MMKVMRWVVLEGIMKMICITKYDAMYMKMD